MRSPVLAERCAYLRMEGEEATRAAEANHEGDRMIWA